MILITGYPRSGTTLFANKFSEISGLFVGPESQYYRNVKRRLDNNGVCNWYEILRNDRRLSDYDFSDDVIYNALESAGGNAGLLFYELLSEYNKSNGYASVVVEKSPAHIIYWQEIIASMPSAKFIYVIRDPRDVVISNIAVNWTHDSVWKHAIEWNMYDSFYSALAREYPDRVVLVKFEEFLQDPEATLDKVLSSFRMSHAKGESYGNRAVPEWEVDWKRESLLPPNPGKIAAWKDCRDKSKVALVQWICRRKLLDYGYALDVSLKPKFVQKVLFNRFLISVLIESYGYVRKKFR